MAKEPLQQRQQKRVEDFIQQFPLYLEDAVKMTYPVLMKRYGISYEFCKLIERFYPLKRKTDKSISAEMIEVLRNKPEPSEALLQSIERRRGIKVPEEVLQRRSNTCANRAAKRIMDFVEQYPDYEEDFHSLASIDFCKKYQIPGSFYSLLKQGLKISRTQEEITANRVAREKTTSVSAPRQSRKNSSGLPKPQNTGLFASLVSAKVQQSTPPAPPVQDPCQLFLSEVRKFSQSVDVSKITESLTLYKILLPRTTACATGPIDLYIYLLISEDPEHQIDILHSRVRQLIADEHTQFLFVATPQFFKQQSSQSCIFDRLAPQRYLSVDYCSIKPVSYLECTVSTCSIDLSTKKKAGLTLILYFHSEPVAMMTFSLPTKYKQYDFEITDFSIAAGISPVGAASSLIGYFTTYYFPHASLVIEQPKNSFLKRLWSALDFEQYAETYPTYKVSSVSIDCGSVIWARDSE